MVWTRKGVSEVGGEVEWSRSNRQKADKKSTKGICSKMILSPFMNFSVSFPFYPGYILFLFFPIHFESSI